MRNNLKLLVVGHAHHQHPSSKEIIKGPVEPYVHHQTVVGVPESGCTCDTLYDNDPHCTEMPV